MPLEETAKCADNWSVARPTISRKLQSPNVNYSRSPPSNFSKPHSSSRIPETASKRMPNHSNITCHNCGATGHYKSQCKSMPGVKSANSHGHSIGICWDSKISPKYMSCGTINGCNVSTILRDTGCSCVVVSSDVLPDIVTDDLPVVSLSDFLGRVSKFPVCKCYLKCPFYDGWGRRCNRPH